MTPNGLALSIDENTLYVAFTYASMVGKYSVSEEGSITNTTMIPISDGLNSMDINPDGLTVFSDGTLAIASSKDYFTLVSSDETTNSQISLLDSLVEEGTYGLTNIVQHDVTGKNPNIYVTVGGIKGGPYLGANYSGPLEPTAGVLFELPVEDGKVFPTPIETCD